MEQEAKSIWDRREHDARVKRPVILFVSYSNCSVSNGDNSNASNSSISDVTGSNNHISFSSPSKRDRSTVPELVDEQPVPKRSRGGVLNDILATIRRSNHEPNDLDAPVSQSNNGQPESGEPNEYVFGATLDGGYCSVDTKSRTLSGAFEVHVCKDLLNAVKQKAFKEFNTNQEEQGLAAECPSDCWSQNDFDIRGVYASTCSVANDATSVWKFNGPNSFTFRTIQDEAGPHCKGPPEYGEVLIEQDAYNRCTEDVVNSCSGIVGTAISSIFHV